MTRSLVNSPLRSPVARGRRWRRLGKRARITRHRRAVRQTDGPRLVPASLLMYTGRPAGRPVRGDSEARINYKGVVVLVICRSRGLKSRSKVVAALLCNVRARARFIVPCITGRSHSTYLHMMRAAREISRVVKYAPAWPVLTSARPNLNIQQGTVR